MSHYLKIDGMLAGTGIRDTYKGGYIEPKELGLSDKVCQKISDWLDRYHNEFYGQYQNKDVVEELDKEGIEICKIVQSELPDAKIEYYPDALLKLIV